MSYDYCAQVVAKGISAIKHSFNKPGNVGQVTVKMNQHKLTYVNNEIKEGDFLKRYCRFPRTFDLQKL